ncbi:hypothetical protein [Aquisphaera giovannonii]|uniref:hypothetical protein n=1 Tax=Aquisphaera giovannonii TaxID=406548 RepID=UPI0011E05024|nr:hypothetical protein [Aquisphaera giovannonii]
MTAAAPPPDFQQDRILALVLAGTVSLPSTPPATGDLFLTRDPEPIPDLTAFGVLPTPYFIKIVQVVSPLCVVTRTLALKDLRAVTIPDPEEAGREQPRRVTLPLARIVGHIEKLARDLGDEVEHLLFEKAVIHVPEGAQVLVRVDSYFGVTAAEAAQHLIPPGKTCCH